MPAAKNEISYSDYSEIKSTLINCLASELRASLYEPLIKEIGHDRTMILLLAAEQKAKSAVRTLPYKSLIGV